MHRLSTCDTHVLLLCSIWDLPGSGLEPMSPALAVGFFTTEPPAAAAVTSVVSNSVQPHGLCSTPGSSVQGILQARVLEWVAVSFSRASSQSRD